MSMKQKAILVVLILFAVAQGFLRDHIFVSLNHTIESGADTEGKLSMLKWGLTVLFSLSYLLNTIFVLYLLFKSGAYVWFAIYTYGFLFAVSFTAGLFGYFFSTFTHVYPFIRTVMGVAQSPIVMMVLITACYLNEKLLKS